MSLDISLAPSEPTTAPPTPMKVAFVSETWTPEINGVTHTLSKLVARLRERHYVLQLIRPRPDESQREPLASEELQVKAFPVLDYDGVHIGWINPARLRAFWKAHRPDVIYIATEGPLGMVALRVARQLGLPIVSGFHTNFDQYSRHYLLLRLVRPFVSLFLKRFHNKTAMTLVPTQQQADRMTSWGYRRVKVMGRGLDHALFSPAHRDDALRTQWGASAQDSVALYVGRLAIEKNIPLLIESLQALRQQNPHQIAVVVGDGPMRKEVEKNLPWVHCIGFQQGENLARYYASADFFVFPSLSETFGNVVTEAMASGLAVIAFDYAAAGELIHTGTNGIVVSCNNKRAFTEAVLRLQQDPVMINRLKTAARERVAPLKWSRIADTFIDYLHQAKEHNDA